MLDFKITNATIIDGTGVPRFAGEVGVRDGRCVAVGEVTEAARETLDAEGKIVAPGFIDLHTHYDAQAFWDPALSPSCFHGVTTVLGGFCGFSIAPLSSEGADYLLRMLSHVEDIPVESLRAGVPWNWTSFGSYLDKLDGTLALNAGFMVGHSAIRRTVMGERAVGHHATDDELDRMKTLLRESLSQGALGFSTSVSPTHNDGDGNPVPSRHAKREEILELARICREFEGSTVELLPAVNFEQETLELLADVSLAAQRPVNWNLLAMLNTSEQEVKRIELQLSASDFARTLGAEVVALSIPTTPTVRANLFSGALFESLPGWGELFRLPVSERMNRVKDRDLRRRLLEQGLTGGVLSFVLKFDVVRVTEVFSEKNRPYLGKTVGEIAKDEGKEPIDTLFDIAIADGLKTVFMPSLGAEDQELYEYRARLWRDDRVVIGGSDAGAHVAQIDTFAFSSNLLQKGVREFGVISFEEAVHQITQVPAQLMGLKDRGVLQPGYWADIVIFDPETVGSGPVHTRFDLPGGAGRLYAEAEGIAVVLVNGQVVIRDNNYTGATPGRLFHSGRDTYTVTIPATSEAAGVQ